MVAMVGVAVDQLPPPPLAGSLSVTDVPGQTSSEPTIVPAKGAGFTLATLVANADPHIFVTWYMMVDVPSDTPVSIPAGPIVATPVADELQVPPATVSCNNMESPTQTIAVPVMIPAKGDGLTVTIAVVNAVAQLFVTA